jgi:hypothetical protein
MKKYFASTMKNILENNKHGIVKDDKFKIELSMEDIDKIEEEVKNI